MRFKWPRLFSVFEVHIAFGTIMVKIELVHSARGEFPELDRSALSFADIANLYGRPPTSPLEPWVRLNFVSTIDGSVTGGDGLSGSISSESDRLVFRALRCLTDVVLVAAGTVRDEGYVGPLVDEEQREWRRSAGLAADPEFAVVTKSLDLNFETLQASPVTPILFTPTPPSCPRAQELSEVARIVHFDEPGETLVAGIRSWFAAQNIRQVLCEGGPSLAGAFISAGGLDEICLTITPLASVGTGPRVTRGEPSTHYFDLRHVLASAQGDLHLRYIKPE